MTSFPIYGPWVSQMTSHELYYPSQSGRCESTATENCVPAAQLKGCASGLCVASTVRFIHSPLDMGACEV